MKTKVNMQKGEIEMQMDDSLKSKMQRSKQNKNWQIIHMTKLNFFL